MNALRIGISTQTPFLRFLRKPAKPEAVTGKSQVLIQRFQEGVDYQLTPGGVCRMVLPTLREWDRQGALREAHWFSLQPIGPRQVRLEGLPLTLHHLALPAEELAAYARTKEKLWADIHGLVTPRFDTDDFRFYSRYNWFTSDALMTELPDMDIAYVHDFQLMQVGALLGLGAPSVLRWHVPFDPARMPRYTRNFLVRAMEDFDAVVVSTRRDLEGLLRAGYRGSAKQIYPHIDETDWPEATPAQIQAFEDAYGFQPDDEIVLCTARLDPIKRQDVAIRALARLRNRRPRAHLLMVGNGSFSGAGHGGLSLDKPRRWKDELENLVHELKLEDRIVFADWVADRMLAAAYTRAQALVLPSDIEGFGLTVLEAWHYRRPALVSAGAGVSEIIHDGFNGYVFPAGDDERLAEQWDEILSDAKLADSMGHLGKRFLRHLGALDAAPQELEVLHEAITRFGGT